MPFLDYLAPIAKTFKVGADLSYFLERGNSICRSSNSMYCIANRPHEELCTTF